MRPKRSDENTTPTITRPGLRRETPDPYVLALKSRARALTTANDLESLLEEIASRRIVMLGESTHGTHEFYEWRRLISERLISRHGFRFIAVEGDWPPAWELDRFVKHHREGPTHDVLRSFRRWPTWMWANEETARLAEWLREFNASRPEGQRAGFYGLDVYSLFESIDVVLRELDQINPFLAKGVAERYACFDSFDRNERAYAKSLLVAPEGCEAQVTDTLSRLLRARLDREVTQGDAFFDAVQNARIVANAERYYRAMVFADETSWNVRDQHMLDTLEVLLDRHGPQSKAIVWAHNTHIGDYRATPMARQGNVNLGGLAREKWGEDSVALVGFGTYEGETVASAAWDGAIEKKTIPAAPPDTLEGKMHEVSELLKTPAFSLSLRNIQGASALDSSIGHRAIGVVYHPEYERHGNYVPTELKRRYDAFLFIDQTRGLSPIAAEFDRAEIPETYPRGL